MKANNKNLLWILIVVLMLGACSTNSVLIGYFYGRMDNRMHERILQYASFSEAQKSEIKQSVDTFFLWHRTNEMPKYAEYIGRLSDEIEAGAHDEYSILGHLKRVRKLSQESFDHSPLAQAGPFLQALSDKQVAQVEGHLKKRDDEFNEWYEERQINGSDDKRIKKIVKNIGRLGIKLDQEQASIIRVGLDSYRGGPRERFLVWNKWEAELVTLLRDRSQIRFMDDVSQHLASYQDQMRLHSPDNHAYNQKNTAKIINDLLESLTLEQKKTLLKKLRQTEKSLYSIASR